MIWGGGFFTRLYLASKYDDDEAHHLSLLTTRLLRYFLSTLLQTEREIRHNTSPSFPSLSFSLIDVTHTNTHTKNRSTQGAVEFHLDRLLVCLR